MVRRRPGSQVRPVESVYAAFEVKPELNKKYVKYAIDKVRSVRTLDRTSADVIHKGGTYNRAAIDVKPIIGGILTVRNKWAAKNTLTKVDQYQPSDPTDDGFLNIGIALDTLCFDYTPTLEGTSVVAPRTVSDPGRQLIHFAVRLFRQLKALGTVPAVDRLRYEAAFSRTDPVTANIEESLQATASGAEIATEGLYGRPMRRRVGRGQAGRNLWNAPVVAFLPGPTSASVGGIRLPRHSAKRQRPIPPQFARPDLPMMGRHSSSPRSRDLVPRV